MKEHTTKNTPIIKLKAMKLFFLSFGAFTASEFLIHLIQRINDFVLPIGHFLAIVIGLVLADWITGIRAAVKRKEPILAAKMGKTIEKTALYFIALLLSEGMRRTFFPAFPITYITALSISITEFKSNIENIESVTGVSLWEYLKEHLSVLAKKK